MTTLKILNTIVLVIMTFALLYQVVFMLIGFLLKFYKEEAKPDKGPFHRYAAVIAARNEENVIDQLIASLKRQDYPKDLLDIYVIADNCTDQTALVAKNAGAIVIERYSDLRGKGYALDYFFKHLALKGKREDYTGYFVFDADNIVDQNFVKAMNATYNEKGYLAMTSYRNSKNFDENWISAGYSTWFMREAQFLNYPRSILGTTCAISGTGFFVSEKLVKKNGGWPYHLLTEDIEFSVNCAINGDQIGYCKDAMVYDEQPITFKQSFTQRLRWSKGFYQINLRYTFRLLKKIFAKGSKRRFGAYDLLMVTAPSMFLTLFTILINAFVLITCLSEPSYKALQTVDYTTDYLLLSLLNYYLLFLVCGAITIFCEWKKIRSDALHKIFYIFTFPLFMLTYIPIALVALFKKVEWKQIHHFAADKPNSF